jgi:hypothetical protein
MAKRPFSRWAELCARRLAAAATAGSERKRRFWGTCAFECTRLCRFFRVASVNEVPSHILDLDEMTASDEAKISRPTALFRAIDDPIEPLRSRWRDVSIRSLFRTTSGRALALAASPRPDTIAASRHNPARLVEKKRKVPAKFRQRP